MKIIVGIDMFQVGKGRNPTVVNEIFRVRNEGFKSFEKEHFSHITSINAIFNGAVCSRSLCLKICDLIQKEIKSLENLRDFKMAIKKWETRSCLCKIYKIYLHGVGYLQKYF